jgi:exodeoxyribonuclease X
LAVKERGVAKAIVNSIYKPPLPIMYEAMAIHHITEKMTEGKPAFLKADEYSDIKELFENEDTVSVAHNAAFDIGILARENVVPRRTICTYKVARAVDSEEKFGHYKLQYLRYLLGLEIEASAHDAFGDVLVLEGVFEYLIEKMTEEKGSEAAAIEEMIEISARPMLFTTIRFGKHKGKRIEDVVRTDRGYIDWLLKEKKKEPQGEGDWIYSLEHYLAQSKKVASNVPTMPF